MREVMFLLIVFFVVLGIGLGLKKVNFAQWTAVEPQNFVYVQDSRTGLCFAQTSNAMATVPCDAVEHLVD